ncbi:MAG: hypothetical protein M3R15_23735 [Acidobacteriota bacterium]|nr:hypothetical protein [Acidobacteriota bacterium]
MNLNQDAMQAVIQEAFDNAQGRRRWRTASAKAKGEIENNPFIHFDGHAFIILSGSNETTVPARGLHRPHGLRRH